MFCGTVRFNIIAKYVNLLKENVEGVLVLFEFTCAVRLRIFGLKAAFWKLDVSTEVDLEFYLSSYEKLICFLIFIAGTEVSKSQLKLSFRVL